MCPVDDLTTSRRALTAKVTLDACVFSGGSAGTDGGAVYAQFATLLEVVDSTFVANSAVDRGGAVHLMATTARFERGALESNVASSGGALYTSAGDVTLTDAALRANTASGASGGGGALASATALTLKGASDWHENAARGGDGGALRLTAGARLVGALNASGNEATDGTASTRAARDDRYS